MSSGLYLKKLAKMLEVSSFIAFLGNSVFLIIEEAELNQAYLQDMVSRAKPSFMEGMASQAELFCTKD